MALFVFISLMLDAGVTQTILKWLAAPTWCILISSYMFLSHVTVQASAVSTLWFRMWRWQRVGQQTLPAVWNIMTTPPSSGRTQHSRPCFLGTRKVSLRLTDCSSHTTDGVLQSIPCVRFVVVEKCTKHTKQDFFFFFFLSWRATWKTLPIPVCLSLE